MVSISSSFSPPCLECHGYFSSRYPLRNSHFYFFKKNILKYFQTYIEVSKIFKNSYMLLNEIPKMLTFLVSLSHQQLHLP